MTVRKAKHAAFTHANGPPAQRRPRHHLQSSTPSKNDPCHAEHHASTCWAVIGSNRCLLRFEARYVDTAHSLLTPRKTGPGCICIAQNDSVLCTLQLPDKHMPPCLAWAMTPLLGAHPG